MVGRSPYEVKQRFKMIVMVVGDGVFCKTETLRAFPGQRPSVPSQVIIGPLGESGWSFENSACFRQSGVSIFQPGGQNVTDFVHIPYRGHKHTNDNGGCGPS